MSVTPEIEIPFLAIAVKNGDDPLSLAISNDASIEVIKYLADQSGIDFQRNIREGRTYLHAAASKPNAEAVDYLFHRIIKSIIPIIVYRLNRKTFRN